jgi:hypothetical protein
MKNQLEMKKRVKKVVEEKVTKQSIETELQITLL